MSSETFQNSAKFDSTRSPFVYWAQDKESIFLRIEIRDAKQVNFKVPKADALDFSAVDSKGEKYGFCLKLAGNVKKNPTVKNTGAKIDVTLTKEPESSGEFWQFLLPDGSGSRPPWLKFDFDRWQDEDGEEESKENGPQSDFEASSLINGFESCKNKFQEQYKELMAKYMDKAISPEEAIKRMNMMMGTYLMGYNVCMLLAHLYILLCLFYGYFIEGPGYLDSYWDRMFSGLVACTALQYMDVLHSVMGLTKSGWKMVTLQVTGRLAVLWIINGNDEIHSWLPVFILMVNYFLAEQFRYPYYALHSTGISLWPITWLRYSMWMLLYPIGLLMESIIFLRSIPFYYKSGVYSLQLPNAWNFSYNFGIVLGVFTAAVFPFIAYRLLSHMHKQRRKQLSIELEKKRQ
ncbi:protein tyrosine phosphatase-like protein, PTPLA domain-containing protein [Ditylenchus destructor]|uniref:Very-long-chain (3R)-3-hydroxyacyl-CoA dehydratase n=1 Tax=Ditylenchus destructor TaxID=166010 RepID=A0AAD4MW41_9BILA|nr:protein tyrosine phosphatase-like protein, PTPLA domain-containing protein [Ditylenchus destructor]